MRYFLLFLLMLFSCKFGFTQTQIGATMEGEALGDNGGFAVSISHDGSKMAVGSRRNDDAGVNAGSVRVYQESGGVISQQGSDIDGQSAGDRFGYALDLASMADVVAIGGRLNDDGGTDAGSVRIFAFSAGSWIQRGSDIDGTNVGDELGHALAIDGSGIRIVVGVPYFDSSPGTDNGCIRIYDWDGTSWSQYGTDIVGASGDRLGYSVSISNDGSKIIAGAPLSDAAGSNSGLALIFEDNGSAFAYDAQINGLNAGNEAGFCVDISGDGTHVVIGEPKEDTNGDNAGTARVFEKVGMDWTQAGQSLFGRNAIDRMGHRVSIDEDGDRIGLGSPNVNSNQGLVQLYEYNGTAWGQLGVDIYGQSAGDRHGGVAISGDGQRVIVSGWLADGAAGLDSGEARLFGGAPLPIELIRLEGRLLNGKVRIEWATAVEVDNKGFSIERSTNGQQWQQIGFVAGLGHSTSTQEYSFIDENPLFGATYYRLKQVDFGGSFEYTSIITIYNRQVAENLDIYPNPVELGEVDLSFEALWGQDYQIELVNQRGAIVLSRVFTAQKGNNRLSIDFSAISSGVYSIRMLGETDLIVKKIIIY